MSSTASPTPQPQEQELARQIRLALNDAYQYGLEAQGHFDPDLANTALEIAKLKAHAAILALLTRSKEAGRREAEQEHQELLNELGAGLSRTNAALDVALTEQPTPTGQEGEVE